MTAAGRLSGFSARPVLSVNSIINTPAMSGVFLFSSGLMLGLTPKLWQGRRTTKRNRTFHQYIRYMSDHSLPAELIDYLAAGGLLITGNQRLSRYIARQYDNHQQAAGAEAWPSPDVQAWQSWLESCWEQLLLYADENLPRLLTPQQERQCWLNIVQQDPLDAALMQSAALAQTAQQAWVLWQQWNLAEDELVAAANDGTYRFLQWADQFRQLCKQNNWLDNARLETILISHLDGLRPILPVSIRLAGFDELTPGQQALIDAMTAAGISVSHEEQALITSQQSRTVLADTRHELFVAAQWARQQFESGNHDIAVIVPDLSKRRGEVMRVFDDVLCPSSVLPGNSVIDRPYTLSMGEPLSEVPLIRIALLLCQGIDHSIPYDAISAMLHSPYIAGSDSERNGRIKLDIYLRNYNVVNASIWKLKAHVTRFNEEQSCPVLLAQLENLVGYLDKLPRQQTAAAWAQSFVDVLKCFGWPGRSLGSEEYQAYSHWDDVISELAALDAFTDRLNRSAALSILQRIAREKIFQVKSASTPVQVLGALEAVGMQFDTIWVTGMTDEAWPPAASANALLPVSVQRKHGLPHSSAEREYHFIQTVHQRISSSAREIIFSWPAMEGDKELAPSPFIREMPAFDPGDNKIELSPYAQQLHAAAPGFEQARDEVIAIAAGDKARGGTGLLKQQSACPFSAFAFYRLNIRPLEEPEVGLDPRQRGSLMHDVMQAIWQQLQSHKQLCALDDVTGTIKPIIDACVDSFMQQQAQKPPMRFIELEKQRLLQRLTQWLDQEKQRTPFTVVALEQGSKAYIGDLQVNTRLDRLDETEQGLIAIDYKTGEPRPAAWLGERPEEPQLPMYVEYDELMQGKPLAGVLFGCLKKGSKNAFAGIVTDEVTAPGAKTADKQKAFRDAELFELDAVSQYWKKTLLQLARQYMQGEAAVDPRDGNACLYCGLESLCRVYELNKRLEHNNRQYDDLSVKEDEA